MGTETSSSSDPSAIIKIGDTLLIKGEMMEEIASRTVKTLPFVSGREPLIG